jgi:3-oxoacyl-[acyl-carrier protein] reductase
VVTGGSRGLGAAVVRALAEAGFNIALTYRENRAGAEGVAATVEGAGRRAAVYQVDLADLQAVASLASLIADRHRPAVLVNNAGETLGGDLPSTETAAAQRLLTVNVAAPLVLVRELAPALSSHDGTGSIVNVSSISGIAGSSNAVYASTKAAILGLTRSLAVELAPAVRVNAVIPGVFATDMNRDALADEGIHRAALGAIPLHRIGDPTELATVIAFLAGPGAAYVTGACIAVDGGILATLPLPEGYGSGSDEKT